MCIRDSCDNVQLHKKLCLNIKNLEKKIIYILIVALKFRKPVQNCARMGLAMENDLLATTSEQIKEPESKLTHKRTYCR